MSEPNHLGEAIKRAILCNGYRPVIIDEVHLPSDKTIPESILERIRNSKFVIADFSYHRNGVYFESGYALGKGKPVIYLCEEDEFKNAHFDTRQSNIFCIGTAEELEAQLQMKIKQWVN
ncbi:MAG: nucleoside 2-deoxyribosyltransferase [Bacteroidetes bacterium]|nr:nucleoside 2-deoxyribosyltransferase [Bacteroidota bacterium]